MAEEASQKTYDIGKDFKDLHVRKRVSVIMTAKNLLKIQQKTAAIIADAYLPVETENRAKMPKINAQKT